MANGMGIYWSNTLDVLDSYFKGVQCGPPPKVINTNYTNDVTVSGSTAHYNCLPGFIYKAADNVKVCSDDGIWEGEDLLCQGTHISSLIYELPLISLLPL